MMDEIGKLSLETSALKAELSDLDRLAQGFGNRMVSAFAGAALHGRNLQDVLKGLALSLSQMALSQALKPLGNLLGGMMAGAVPHAAGNAFANGRVIPFADGGIVNSPVLFPMRGATGLMGEAGPEAIMPLARGADGKLGVRGGGGAAHVTVNISTPDAPGFRHSQAQVAALITRAVARGQRNL